MTSFSPVNFASERWLAVVIGNSRCHFALFQGESLIKTWNTSHFQQRVVNLPIGEILPVYLASVVLSQTQLWQDYPLLREIRLSDIPLPGLYPTMGCDRALAIWGAIQHYHTPSLVIDAGTALTFTGASLTRFAGGAILPGLGLQLRSLSQQTAALPEVILPSQLPPRWSDNTSDAIASGIIYTALATIGDFSRDWLQRFPEGQLLLTGGDGERLLQFLGEAESDLTFRYDPHLAFWGMRSLRQDFSA
ncbi:MAG: pantothenate kinase [Jaaginema sp. PMC 1079.18]|nr:pantothenate kinase [Jaaginema sp. PMC 1080.18]MEC4851808.1 pantothenate kinase [Jaaginema sp. PMC 1079.18]MEC4868358.1 pantothenate kinase [Jaaginema sp. PMC 1078.18]